MTFAAKIVYTRTIKNEGKFTIIFNARRLLFEQKKERKNGRKNERKKMLQLVDNFIDEDLQNLLPSLELNSNLHYKSSKINDDAISSFSDFLLIG